MYDRLTLFAIDKGELVIGFFLDLKKAFNTVNHEILLKKLYRYGIRGLAFEWLCDYLDNRQQFFSFDNMNSKYEKVTCGVPQGSILGPLLFLLYINDMANLSKHLFMIIFADDTNIFLKGKNLNDTIKIFNEEMIHVFAWLIANRLSVNIAKTHFIIFRSPQRKIEQHDTLMLNGQAIERVESTKFIGIVLDSTINWNKHIQYFRSKISRSIGIICKARKIFSVTTLVTLYNSFIYPYLIYCIEVWGSAADIHISSLFRLQKKTIRIIKSAPFKATTKPLFRELKLLPLECIYRQRVCIFMFKFVKNMLPDVFDDIFLRNTNINRRQTRQNYNLKIPYCRTTMFQRTIRYQGVKEWNSTSAAVDHYCSVHTFKKRLKKYLLDTFI
jgi:hypothetical protein